MRRCWPAVSCVPFWVGAVCLISASPADAQLMSKWGHPVFSLGWTPYDAPSAGHGNYIGSNGFIPGYGYYLGSTPAHYPWYDGPDEREQGSHEDHSAPAASPYIVPGRSAFAPRQPEPEVMPGASAILTIRVPADAEIWFNGCSTTQGGTLRRFVTPVLADEGIQSYDVRARWTENGKVVERTRRVDVRAGDRLTVDFVARPTTGPLGTAAAPSLR